MTAIGPAIDDYLAALRNERGMSTNTVAAYRRDLGQYRRMLDEAGVTELDAIGDEQVAEFLSWMRTQGWKPATVSRKLAAITGFHRFTTAEDLAATDPTTLIDRPSRSRSLPKALTVDEAIRLVETPDPTVRLGRRDRALLEFMYATGARAAETVGLDLDDVDFDTATARVVGKGDRHRIVPIGSHALSAIEHYLPERLDLLQT